MSKKLTYEQAEVIRLLSSQGRSVVRLAQEYGVNPTTIYSVLKGLTHKEAQETGSKAPVTIKAAAQETQRAKALGLGLEDVMPPEVAAIFRAQGEAAIASLHGEKEESEDVLDRLNRDVRKERGTGKINT